MTLNSFWESARAQLVDFQNDEYVSKVATTSKQACDLLEAGFEYICTTPDALMLFRKRK